MPSRSYLKAFRILVAVALAVAGIAVVFITYGWPLVGDAQIFHYAHFLMEHGFIPYRDIPDINMPGCHITEAWAMRLFGGSDLGWRLYEFTLFVVLSLAMILIARPYDWLAGLFAGIIFALQRTADGPWDSVERDEIMAVLIIVAYAFLFEGLRRRKPWLLFGFGLCLGVACSIKPTVAPLFLALLVMAIIKLRKEKQPIASYSAWSIAGAVAIGGYVLMFLFRKHAFSDFLYDVRTYTSFYVGIDRAPTLWMLHHAIPFKIGVIFVFAFFAAGLRRGWANWESWAIGAGIAFGAFSYLAQGKGFRHHAFPLMAATLLWVSIELTMAMKDTKPWVRSIGIAGIVVGTFICIPIYVHHLRQFVSRDDFSVSLESDLTQLGGPALNHRIQCLDTVYGCFNALYHLRIIQRDGILGDLILFTPKESLVVDRVRKTFLDEISSDPPSVIVITNQWFYRPPSFNKINGWPQFAAYLSDNYQLVLTRHFPAEGDSAYRIYERRGVSPLANSAGTN